MKNLKLKVGEYEISISAKYVGDQEASKRCTMNFLCSLSMLAASADCKYIDDGKPIDGYHRTLASGFSDDLYQYLKDNHYYKS